MLDFSLLFDAHFHLFSQKNALNEENLLQNTKISYSGCTCAVSKADFLAQEKFIGDNELDSRISQSFGIHPWYLNLSEIDFLESLLKDKKIRVLGEMGFDFYDEKYSFTSEQQEKAWYIQLELAKQFNVPVVIHCRKAFERIIKDSEKLNSLPFVLFHGFSGSFEQANQISLKVPGAYFSFGKTILQNSKKACSCIKKLPSNKIILETDDSGIEYLPLIYKKASEIRCINEIEFAEQIRRNIDISY